MVITDHEKGQGLLLHVGKVLGTSDTPEESVFLRLNARICKNFAIECLAISPRGKECYACLMNA